MEQGEHSPVNSKGRGTVIARAESGLQKFTAVPKGERILLAELQVRRPDRDEEAYVVQER